MNAEQYIRSVVRKHMVKKQVSSQALFTARELYPWIRKWANNFLGGIDQSGSFAPPRNYLLRIYPTGSFAKGTNLLGGTDIDFLISLHHKTPGTLGNIYDSFLDYLKLCGLPAGKQNVSIRVNYKGLSIDLVPAKKHGGPTNDHSIYRRKAGTWTKTNVHKHVLHVKKSGRLNEIRAAKIWRELHELDFPSFYLELSVIEALKGCSLHKLSVNLVKVFEYLGDDFENLRIIDPANSNNIVSDDLTAKEKQNVAEMARSSLQEQYWHNIIW